MISADPVQLLLAADQHPGSVRLAERDPDAINTELALLMHVQLYTYYWPEGSTDSPSHGLLALLTVAYKSCRLLSRPHMWGE